ncbi:transporter [Rhizobium sp. P38BS-XIX]|uniref:OmpP1/FadL family transporter n=1 Tax=Rhizobium sp. P38BS-XIX TaxID=2726740 RepID=UPI0014578BE5|nr:OmpP1/FadL family transporter [Rhizobium sp. P38BS-XIX]NLR95892.1 transporter [Rhizobium sp. P38BS-XIX]
MAFSVALKGAVALVISSSFASAAFAGGLDRGGYDIDLLFDKGRYVFESGVTYVMPDRKLKNAKDINPADGNLNNRSHSADASENYAIPYVAFKIGITDDLDCMADYSQPFGGHLNEGLNWAGANNEIETKVRTNNYAATCSYKFDAGPGQLRVIGGGFYQEVSGFKSRLVSAIPAPLSSVYDGVGSLDVDGHGWGWRAGLAYEIPEYAFRTSLVYNSRVKYDNLKGSVDLTELPPIRAFFGKETSVFGSADAPDSLEWKVQSGIAPDWLAFGSVKWTNWSLLQSIALCPTSTRGVSCKTGSPTELTSLDLLYRDGWTVTGGIGHKFNDKWSGAVSLTWDRGTSDGYGINSDTWTLGAGLAYKATEHVQFNFGGALGLMTSGKSGPVTRGGIVYGDDATYSFGNDLVAALQTSMKVSF